MHGAGSPVSGEDLGPGCGRSVKPEAESQEQLGWGVGEVARIWVWDLGAGGGGSPDSGISGSGGRLDPRKN